MFQKQMDEAVVMAVDWWVNCHGHPGFRPEQPLRGNVPKNCLSSAKEIIRETLDRRIDLALAERKAQPIPMEPSDRLGLESPMVNTYPLEGYFRNAIWRALSIRYRFVLSSTKDSTSPIFLITRRARHWQKSTGNVLIGNAPDFKFEHDEVWSNEERRAPVILGEESNQSSSVPVLYTGGFETNRSRH
ncbi:hypothetical protein H0A65_15280 [Alcaligenaceae bacterium]|nr:hypothetical protein [Alcaligenaceae bacterium]